MAGGPDEGERMRGLTRVSVLIAMMICVCGVSLAQRPSVLDRIMQRNDEIVLYDLLALRVRDKRYDALTHQVSARLNPHIAEVFRRPAKSVAFYVFFARMGFNAKTWDRIVVFDSLLLDAMRHLCYGLAVYGTTDCDYVHKLADYVVKTDHAYKRNAIFVLDGPPENPFSLPTIWGLTPEQSARADQLFEDMLAGWMAHEASHAFLDHARELVLARYPDATIRDPHLAADVRAAIQAPYSFSRQKEREADEHAVRLLIRSGYKIDALIQSFEFAQQIEELSGEANLTDRDRTHPTPLERIILARQIAAEEAKR